jgi:lysophospholipase L1-like esterase
MADMSKKFLVIASTVLLALIAAGPATTTPATRPTTKPGVVRIACCGDSMTRRPVGKSYSDQLAKFLGDRYDVRNFGHDGVTALRDSGRPFVKMPEFDAADTFEPNVVVLMLGTNDAANRADVWQRFADDMLWLVHHYQSLPSKPRVILMTPPPLMPGREDPENRLTNLRDKVSPIVRRIAKDEKLTLVELQDDPALADASLYPDKVHLNESGAKIVAQRVRDALGGAAQHSAD